MQAEGDSDTRLRRDRPCGHERITLFKNIYDEDSFNSYGFVGHCTDTFESRQSYHDIEGAHPASKEQRDLLFQKMKEAGYEWDAEKKELKKIEQKPAWSEEDEKKLLCVCAWIKDYPRIADFKDEMYTVANNYINWLKSLRPQKQWKPSDEQMGLLQAIVNDPNNASSESCQIVLKEVIRQLKKLKG